jgi:hypothetical protein
MKLLIGAGAKVGATNKMGLSAFEMGLFYGHDGLEELIAGGYRLPPDKAKLYETTYAQKPTVLGLVRKAAKCGGSGRAEIDRDIDDRVRPVRIAAAGIVLDHNT